MTASSTSVMSSARSAQYRFALMRHIDPSLEKEALRLSVDTDGSNAGEYGCRLLTFAAGVI